MKPDSLINSLLPDFDKERITEDIRITLDELRSVTIPAFKDADTMFGRLKFQSPHTLKLISVFNTNVKVRKGNIITSIYRSLEQTRLNLIEVEKMVDRGFGEDIIGKGITFYKAALLQFTECAQFNSRFSRRLLNYIYVAETAMLDESVPFKDVLTPADIEWIEGNFLNFCFSLNATSKDKKAEQYLRNVPNIVITPDNTDTLRATLGEDQVDPLKAGFIPVWLNPIYHVRMAIAEWQTNRYHAARQEVKCLQLRKANLEALHAGKPNPKVQKELSVIEDRIQSYLRKNAEMEKRYG